MKSQFLVIVLITKILADSLWWLSPVSIADNVYYVSQSAWFLLATLCIAAITDTYIRICAWYMVIYAAIDLINEVMILLGMITLSQLDMLIFIVSIVIILIIFYEVYRHNKK